MIKIQKYSCTAGHMELFRALCQLAVLHMCLSNQSLKHHMTLSSTSDTISSSIKECQIYKAISS